MSIGSKCVEETMHIKIVAIIKLHYRDKCVYKKLSNHACYDDLTQEDY